MRNNVEKLKSYRSFRVPVEETDKIGFKVFYTDDRGVQDELSATLLVNVSLTGVGFYTGKEILDDYTIDVQLTFKGVKFLIPGTIVRSQVIYNAYGEREKFFYGIQFLESDQELTKNFLSKFISSFSAKRLKNHLINLLMNEGKLSGHDDTEKIELLLSLYMDMIKFVDVPNFLQLLFIETARLTDAGRCNLFLLDETKTEMVLFDWDKGVQADCSFSFKGSLVEKVFHHRKIINHRINKFDSKDSFYNLLLAHYDMETSSVLLAPVFDGKGQIVGMIEFANKLGEDFFKEDDEVFIQLLSRVVTSIFDTREDHFALDIEDHSKVQIPRKFDLIGNSHFANEMRAFAKKCSSKNDNIVLNGEKGTGKSLLAHMIHIESDTGAMACGKLNCISIETRQDMLLTLHGDSEHVGKLELYTGGTIILENVTKLNLENQQLLLESLSTREDIRLITLCSYQLNDLVEEGLFLEELRQHLSTIVFEVPSLKYRNEDIPDLADYYLQKNCHERGLLPKKLSEEVLEQFCSYSWPGNILELKTAMERIVMYYPNNHVIREISSEIIPIFNTYTAQENAYKEILEGFDLDKYGLKSEEFVTIVKAHFLMNEFEFQNEDFEKNLERFHLNVEEYNNIISEAKYILDKYQLDDFITIKEAA